MRLIDADALQRKICGAKCGCEYEDCGNEGDCEFAHFIFWAPTVDAEPVRHGKWIPIIDEPHTLRSFAMLTGYKCSECGRRKSNEEPYCSCGAKMDGE